MCAGPGALGSAPARAQRRRSRPPLPPQAASPLCLYILTLSFLCPLLRASLSLSPPAKQESSSGAGQEAGREARAPSEPALGAAAVSPAPSGPGGCGECPAPAPRLQGPGLALLGGGGREAGVPGAALRHSAQTPVTCWTPSAAPSLLPPGSLCPEGGFNPSPGPSSQPDTAQPPPCKGAVVFRSLSPGHNPLFNPHIQARAEHPCRAPPASTPSTTGGT